MQDEATSEEMSRVNLWAFELAKPVAAVCHGHCGMLRMRDADGNWPEELRRLGADYSKAPLIWDSYVVEDRNLITGQNPYSSLLVAETFLRKLGESRARAQA